MSNQVRTRPHSHNSWLDLTHATGPSEDRSEDCPICQEAVEPGEPSVIHDDGVCRIAFHEACFNSLLYNHEEVTRYRRQSGHPFRCPWCRRDINHRVVFGPPVSEPMGLAQEQERITNLAYVIAHQTDDVLDVDATLPSDSQSGLGLNFITVYWPADLPLPDADHIRIFNNAAGLANDFIFDNIGEEFVRTDDVICLLQQAGLYPASTAVPLPPSFSPAGPERPRLPPRDPRLATYQPLFPSSSAIVSSIQETIPTGPAAAGAAPLDSAWREDLAERDYAALEREQERLSRNLAREQMYGQPFADTHTDHDGIGSGPVAHGLRLRRCRALDRELARRRRQRSLALAALEGRQDGDGDVPFFFSDDGSPRPPVPQTNRHRRSSKISP